MGDQEQQDQHDQKKLLEEIQKLRAENEALRRRESRSLTLKVSPKGGVSVYGLGRFPVTLYQEQWTRLLDFADEIRQFLIDNDAQLRKRS